MIKCKGKQIIKFVLDNEIWDIYIFESCCWQLEIWLLGIEIFFDEVKNIV